MYEKPKTLLLKIPLGDGGDTNRFEQVFIQLYEALRGKKLSLEVIGNSQAVSLWLVGSPRAVDAACGQIYGIIPDTLIEECADPLSTLMQSNVAASEVTLARSDLLPLRDYHSLGSKSFSTIASVLARCEHGQQFYLQIVISPRADTVGSQAALCARRMSFKLRRLLWLKYLFKRDVVPTFAKEIKGKIASRLFYTSIRIAVLGGSTESSQDELLERFKHALSSFNTIDYNRLSFKSLSPPTLQRRFIQRAFYRPFILSAPELSAWFHFPKEKDVPNISRLLSRRAPPPKNLPTSSNRNDPFLFGETNFRGQRIPFGMTEADRKRHMYVVGKSGAGKSKLLELLIRNDVMTGKGAAILDPHGDLVDNVLQKIPAARLKDVVIFDPSDIGFPASFNPLESVPEHLKMRVTIGFIEIFKKLFGTNWSPRLEHVLRYTTLALLDTPDTTTLSILLMLSNKDYRQAIVQNIKDHVVKNFWVNEFAGWSEKFDAEAITPLLNKVGQFVSTNMIRNIVGQPGNKFNFGKLMDERKIVLMKVSKGLLGHENASLLGAMIVTKLFQAAMARAEIPEKERVPFSFYVDEFHNFATGTFGEILSEARKYGLHIILANQFLGQLDASMKKTVFGNVGTLIGFRLGAEDAAVLAGEFSPRFTAEDIINLGAREFCIKMTIDGQMSEAFSGQTLEVRYPARSVKAQAIQWSRQRYAKPVAEVERLIAQWHRQGSKPGPTAPELKFIEPLV